MDAKRRTTMDAETRWLLESGLGAIGKARAEIPILGWKLAGAVKERVEPEGSELARRAVEKADAVLALFEPSGEPRVMNDVLAIARAQAELEDVAVRLLDELRSFSLSRSERE